MAAPGDDGASTARPGGSPMNVAIGLARLGQPAAFVGRISDDPIGILLRRHLERSGVDLRHVVQATEPSTIAVVDMSSSQANYQFSRGGADFQWSPAELAFLPNGALAVHFGSLASWMPPGDAAIEAVVGQAATRRLGTDQLRPQRQTDAAARRRGGPPHGRAVRAGRPRGQGQRGGSALALPRGVADAVARRWLDLGVELVVVTAGPEGATAWTRRQAPVSRPAFLAPVVDTVGAGDAFTSGLLDGLARRGLLTSAALAELDDPAMLAAVLDDAALIAGITVSRAGADPPRRPEADALR